MCCVFCHFDRKCRKNNLRLAKITIHSKTLPHFPANDWLLGRMVFLVLIYNSPARVNRTSLRSWNSELKERRLTSRRDARRRVISFDVADLSWNINVIFMLFLMCPSRHVHPHMVTFFFFVIWISITLTAFSARHLISLFCTWTCPLTSLELSFTVTFFRNVPSWCFLF